MMLIPVAARSKTLVLSRLFAGIAGSNSTRGMDVCHFCLYVVLSCVGRGLCDGQITRPEESYRVSDCMRDLRIPETVSTFQMGSYRKMNE
jgi:hypothetical protein